MVPIKEALTFDDVTLAPKYSEILPSEVNTTVQLTRNLKLKIPLLSSAMDTVTESKMAIAIAKSGGIGVIHRNLDIQNQILEIKKHIKDKIDVVMSDMAVNTTGIKNIDSIQTGELCKEAMFFAKDQLKNNGHFISKIFMGGTFNEIVAEGKKYFKEVKVFKPKSSRKDSKESFIICSKLR